jgi:two-component system OmpR family response regulator
VLSALDQVSDRITGLRAGGDDYLVKPFALGELSARLEVLVRRPTGGAQTVLHVGPLALDLIQRRATRGARVLDLLAREFQLLEYLMRREAQVVTRQMLMEDVFGYRFEVKTNLVDVHMGRLRRKLDQPDEAPLLTTVRGLGFVLRAAD